MTLVAVLPGDVDTVPSGGNLYDRRVLAELRAAGFAVREHAFAGTWPRPGPAATAALTDVLDGLDGGTEVLLDGLVACAAPEALAPHAGRLRLVVLVHLPLAEEARDDAAELHARERAALHHASAVVTTSRWCAERIVAGHGLDPAVVHVAPPGVDAAPVAAGSAAGGDPPRMLCLGALTPTKGQDVLVAALAELADLRWTAALVGPLTRDPGFVVTLWAAIARHGLAGRVTLTGPRWDADRDAALAAADLLVVPSRIESYGMVITEALARGVPVVASAVGGIPEALDAPDGRGEPGASVPPDDPRALAGVLRRALSDAGLRDVWRIVALGRRGSLAGWPLAAGRLAAALRSPPAEPPGTPLRDDVVMTPAAPPSTDAPPDATSGPGAPRCAPEWLALREPADHAARDASLAGRLAARLAARPDAGPEVRPDVSPDVRAPLVVRDLGCGAGSMARWLAPRMPAGDQRWVLQDRDADLVARAAASMPPGVRAEPVVADLAALDATALAGTDAVVSSALLDLLTAAEVRRLARLCADARCPALVSLSFSGEVTLHPGDELDAPIGEAFDAHQRREQDGRRLLGPDAPGVAAAAFADHGFEVIRAATPWRLGPGDAALVEEWLRGRLDAACAQVPALRSDAPAYLARRLDALAAGALHVEVGHVDVLALPGAGR